MKPPRDLGAALRSVGDAYVAEREADLAAVRAAVARGRRRRIFSLVAAGAAVAVSGLVAVAVVVNLRDGNEPRPSVAAPIDFDLAIDLKAPYQVDARRDRAFVALAGHSIARLDGTTGRILWTTQLTSRPEDVGSGPDVLWVTLPSEDRIVRLDPATGAEVAEVRLGVGSEPRRLTVGPRAIRATVNDGVVRVGVSDGVPRKLYEGDIGDIAMGEHGLWLVNDKGAIFAIDPDTGVPVEGLVADLRTPGGEITFARDAIWYGRPGSDVLIMIDEATGVPAPRIDLPGRYLDLDAGAGGPWVLVDIGGDTGEILELDRAQAALVGRRAIVPGRPTDMSTSGGGIWVTLQQDDKVVHVTP